jgi:hypothetical protein
MEARPDETVSFQAEIIRTLFLNGAEAESGLPDEGTFSNQNFQFGLILVGTCIEKFN